MDGRRYLRRGLGLSTRRLVVVGCLLAVAVATVAGLAVAHGNHATAHPQVSANGTLVVEQAFLTGPGYLVVRADDNGTPGRVLGSRSLGPGLHTGPAVQIDDSDWGSVSGNTTVWTVLHVDNGDGEFDPGADELLTRFGKPAGDRIPVGKRDGAGYVITASGVSDTDGELLVERVALPEQGHVVVHEQDNGSLGRPRGSRALSASEHAGVRVPVNLSTNQSAWPSLSIAIHRDDGDGTFGPDDPVVRVAGEPVASPFGGGVAGSTQPSPVVNTPSGDEGTDAAVRTPAETETATTETATDESDPSGPTSSSGAGFGFAMTILGAVLALLAARHR